MDIVQILRIIFGFALVLFIPGFALTLALWHRTKKEVYNEVLKALKDKEAKNVYIVGSADDVETLSQVLGEGKINTRVYDPDIIGEGTSSNGIREILKTKNIVLADNLESYDIEIKPEGKFIIDMANNFDNAVKIENTIDGIERITLSFGLSIALAPLIGIILDKTAFGITQNSILVSLIAITLLFIGIYYYRRGYRLSNKGA